MDTGQLVYIICRLALGAVAAFLAIMLWSKTRDLAWMFLVIGAIAAYVEVVYSILELYGMTGGNRVSIGAMPVMSIVLPCLPMIFLIIALAVMVLRKYRNRTI